MAEVEAGAAVVVGDDFASELVFELPPSDDELSDLVVPPLELEASPDVDADELDESDEAESVPLARLASPGRLSVL